MNGLLESVADEYGTDDDLDQNCTPGSRPSGMGGQVDPDSPFWGQVRFSDKFSENMDLTPPCFRAQQRVRIGRAQTKCGIVVDHERCRDSEGALESSAKELTRHQEAGGEMVRLAFLITVRFFRTAALQLRDFVLADQWAVSPSFCGFMSLVLVHRAA
jgi:hypothetical protein